MPLLFCKVKPMPVAVKDPFTVDLHRMGVMVLDAAELLVLILADLSQNSQRLSSQVRDVTEEGKRASHSLAEKLDLAAVKPPDMMFLRNTSQALKETLGILQRVSSDLVLFNQKESIPFTAQMAEIISQQSRGIATALSGLRNDGSPLDRCEEIIRLKDEADRLHESSLWYLFEAVKDPIEVIKRKQIINELKLAARAARDVGYLLKPLACGRAKAR